MLIWLDRRTLVCQSSIERERCLTPDELTDTVIRLMDACLRRLRPMKTIRAAAWKMVKEVLSRMDVTGYRSEERHSRMIDSQRECNPI
jgi:hypothetical protein